MSVSANDNRTQGMTDDMIQPFQLEVSNFRGRIVRLNNVLSDILSAHDYPDFVSRVLAEMLAVTTMLGGMLKFEGIFTMQTSGNGVIRSIVCDMTSSGDLRGYVSYDRDRVDEFSDDKEYSLHDVLGDGYMAFTVDQHMAERYQGIVELQKESIIESVQHYFNQSEQINTLLKTAICKKSDGWIASAVMVQKLPEDQKIQLVDKDDWNRTRALLDTCTDKEMLDSELPLNELLYRLFHEEGVRVFQVQELHKNCRCSQQRVFNVLTTLSDDDLDHAEKEGQIEMVCEFCSKKYEFTRADIEEYKNQAE